MKGRVSVVQKLLARSKGTSYLEIGCNRDGTFREIQAARKVGVDPKRGGTLRMTSDEFFAQNSEWFDVVFVDGLHLREQVVRDVDNAVRWLNPGGFVVLHDCLPVKPEHQLRSQLASGIAWTGDVWKAVVELRQRPEFDLAVWDADWGLGVLLVRPNTDLLEPQAELEWEHFVAHRNRLLRVVDEAGLWRFIEQSGLSTSVATSQAAKLATNANPAVVILGRLPGSFVIDTNSPLPVDAPNITLDFQDDTEDFAGPYREGHANEESNSAVAPRADSLAREAVGGGTQPLRIALAHSNMAQFRCLHEYLNASGLAESYLFCSMANYQQYQGDIPNLVPFGPHGGKLDDRNSFYYLKRVEGANRRSLGLAQAIRKFQAERPIDVFVGHVTAGSPSLMFDEFEFPILTYLEFPSFEQHGWDARFPPPQTKRLRDKNFEMLSCHAVLKSDHSIVPSAYAKSLFPAELQPKISVLMEGFSLDDETWNSSGGALKKEEGLQYVGFAARDLSTAKGFDQFVKIANRIAGERSNVRFVVLGGEGILYSYENHFLDGIYGPNCGQSFRDWVVNHEQADESRFMFPGLVDYATYSRFVQDIDLFLYPIQFGSANWGLFELLGRGKVVIASDRCYVPEVIQNGVNGLLCEYSDLDQWTRLALRVLDDLPGHGYLGETARRAARKYSIDQVAREFLALCQRVKLAY